uniref:Uncharacterized protein n=1 Tax=Glossina palpalis gambiensis TaxID=67801 RepID=A0A1B0BR18_9MUSC
MSFSLIKSSIRKSSTGSVADVTDVADGIDLGDVTGDATAVIGARGDVDGGVLGVAGFANAVGADVTDIADVSGVSDTTIAAGGEYATVSVCAADSAIPS